METRHRTTIEINVDDRKIRGLDQTLHRAFDDSLLKAFEDTIARTTRNLEALTKATERYGQASTKARAGGGAGGRGGGGGSRGGDAGLAAAIQALSNNITNMARQQGQAAGSSPSFGNRALATGVGTYLGGLGSRMGAGEGFVAQALGGIPLVGGMLSGAVGSIQRYYMQHVQAQTQRARASGTLGTNRLAGGGGAFTRFGLDMPAAFGQASQFAQQAGLSGSQLTGDFYQRALDLQMLGGIQGGGASILRAQGVGGGSAFGGAGPQGPNAMMAAVAAGIVSGIREARLPQFIQAATTTLEQGRTEGALLGLSNVLAMQRGLSGLGAGFQGEQASRAMSSSTAAMRGFQPGQDAASLIGLRAAGFGRGKSYHQALRAFQENPASVLPNLIREVRGMAPGNEGAQIELMRQVLPKFLGFTPTITQAESLVRGDMSSFNIGAAGDTGAAEGFLEGREGLRGGFGAAGFEAGYRNRQIRLGGQVSGAARQVRDVELRVASRLLPSIAGGIEKVVGYLEGLYNTFQEGGLGEVIKEAFAGLTGAIGEALGLDMEGSADATRQFGEEMARDPEAAVRRLAEDTWDVIVGGARPDDTPTTNRRGLSPPPGTPGSNATYGDPALDEAAGVGPQSSAADALRRSAREQMRAADALERGFVPGEGELALG